VRLRCVLLVVDFDEGNIPFPLYIFSHFDYVEEKSEKKIMFDIFIQFLLLFFLS